MREEWEATTSDGQVGMIRGNGLYRIADCRQSGLSDEENNTNAHLIAAAVNGCISINPENPQAVAESTKEMYEALKALVIWAKGFAPNDVATHRGRVVIAKAEGKEVQ